MKLIYIGGYGHSGSTLLEYLMTGVPELLACGEVADAKRPDALPRTCTCGRPAPDCPVWGFVARPEFQANRYNHADHVWALLKYAEGRYAAMVDSTKTAWRAAALPFRLRRERGENFCLVHIVRDPRGVCWSLLKRYKRVGVKSDGRRVTADTLAGWYYANLACEIYAWCYPRQYVRLRYEDLAREPVETMTGLMKRLLPAHRWDFASIGAQDNRHQLYANRMRTGGLAPETIKLDDAWRSEMPQRVRGIVEALSAPLRARYGYD